MAIKKKVFYSMGEVCEMFDLPASTVRFWTNSISVLRPKKNAKGNRLFTSENIDTFKILYNLIKERGMTIAGAEQYLSNSKSLKKEVSVIETLQTVRSTLLSIRNELDTEIEKGNAVVIKNSEVDEENEANIEALQSKYYEPTIFDL